MITKLRVANRGEIAARVLRTARDMGIATVAVFSDPDRDAPFVALADEAVPLGGAAPAASYLRVEAILDAAERTRADAVHPGYGFLAERAEFAEAVLAAGLRWVGPPRKVLPALGDKLEARRVASEARVPILPAVTYGQFLLALGLVTLAPYAFAASGPLERRSRAFLLVLGTQMVVLVNVAAHVAVAIWARGYAPGLVTALLVNLPFSVFLFRRALRGSWVRPRDLIWLLVAALLVHGPGLVGLMVLAGWAVGAG